MWIHCEKKSADIPVHVDNASCLACSECSKAFDVWLDSLPVVRKTQKDIDLWLKTKAMKGGNCPKIKGRRVACNAGKKFCHNNWFCADDSPRKQPMLLIREENMLIRKVKDKDSLEIMNEKDIRTVNVTSDTIAIYKVTKMITVVQALVPVAKEKEIPEPSIPENISKMKVEGVLRAIESKDGKMLVTGNIALKDFFEDIKTDPTGRALLIDQIYQPTMKVQVVKVPEAEAPKKRTRKPKNGG